jgi:regulator of sigma E protease
MITSVITFIIVLSILVLVHELGHYFVARKNGILAEEFGIGLPPKIWSKKFGDTIISINALPFGGFVRLRGENNEEKVEDKKRSFSSKKKRVRIAVLTAGVIMNVLLGIVSFAIVYSFSGIPRDTKQVTIVEIAQGSPAQIANLIIGDKILTVDKNKVQSNSDFMKIVEEKKGKKVVLEVERKSGDSKETKKFTVTPRENPPAGEGAIGVTISSMEVWFPPVWQRPFVGVYYGTKEAIFWGKTIAVGLFDMVAGLFKGVTPKDVAGPVGIFAVTTEVAKTGILSLINFMGILSINLAILNILPFPALDGGRVFFVALEGIVGKKVLPKVENYVHMIGMIILLALILLITISDIRKLIIAGSLSNFINTMVK